VVLVGKSEGKRPLGRPKRKCVVYHHIKIYLQEVGCGDMDWVKLDQDRDNLVGTCECGNETSGSIKCGEFLD
jgi:hypothetical protein